MSNPPTHPENPKETCCATPNTPSSNAPSSPSATTTSCCPSAGDGQTSCCPPERDGDLRSRPGYRLLPFVEGWIDAQVPRVSTSLTRVDHLGHWAMRWGFGRDRYQVAPGLYGVGSPDDKSPVLVSANYKMSFDLLRRELAGRDAWILVLDTKGINVWCAAGKGTFGTEEIVRRIQDTDLPRWVSHRKLILPQLGAPGVAAHKVKQLSGFSVVYGPVRACDIKAFLDSGLQATEDMRRVTFSTTDRLVLTPVELTGMLRYLLWAVAILFVLAGFGEGWYSPARVVPRGVAATEALLLGLCAGAVLTPIALPWVPGRFFALKGALVGGLCGLFAVVLNARQMGPMNSVALFLTIGVVSSYCAMNFTGSTTFTSPSGVEKEMRRALPLQLVAAVTALAFWLGAAF